MRRRTGRLGQFDVVVDGEVIARRKRGDWPEAVTVIAAIDARCRLRT